MQGCPGPPPAGITASRVPGVSRTVRTHSSAPLVIHLVIPTALSPVSNLYHIILYSRTGRTKFTI